MGIVVIAIGIYAAFLYHDINESRTAGYETTKKQVLSATSVTEIEKVVTFNGAESYHVVFGKTEKNEGRLVFYPLEGNEKTLTTMNEDEMVSEENMLQEWSSRCTDCKFIKIVPGIVDEKVLWEITYRDASDRYVLDYYAIEDGSQYEQYRLKQMFK
ncbi:cell wall elongation regulator TseB-like domain-containing protein [Oceanobacillus manasiensis]|uniref:cell wall elongation regulator TseB-like domain-containing protein n=1 Tax=Oceanobacillus manasiensis TaxID=586413 RepID=UPI0006946554|nr:DUF5590 domain-containing protein [Oceanobacillus manasiensis]